MGLSLGNFSGEGKSGRNKFQKLPRPPGNFNWGLFGGNFSPSFSGNTGPLIGPFKKKGKNLFKLLESSVEKGPMGKKNYPNTFQFGDLEKFHQLPILKGTGKSKKMGSLVPLAFPRVNPGNWKPLKITPNILGPLGNWFWGINSPGGKPSSLGAG